jgi:hypothetical protein
MPSGRVYDYDICGYCKVNDGPLCWVVLLPHNTTICKTNVCANCRKGLKKLGRGTILAENIGNKITKKEPKK